MISPISFTGIKNIGYARIIESSVPDYPQSRIVMNMELTDDKNNKDLTILKNVLQKFPVLKNKINDNYLNIECNLMKERNVLYSRLFMNGVLVLPGGDGAPLIRFAKNLVERVKNLKIKDFKLDKNYHLSEEAKKGLVYNDNIGNYIDGTSGKLDILAKTGLIEKFDFLMNYPNIKLSQKDENKLLKAVDEVVAILHEPAYVKQGSHYLGALIKGYSPINLPS